MKYRAEYSTQASSYLHRASPRTRERVARRVDELCADPFDHRLSKPLHGDMSETRSSRIGDIRVTFRVIHDVLVVLVVRIGPRGDVYKG